MLLGAPGHTTGKQEATLGLLASLLGARTLLGAKGISTRSGIATVTIGALVTLVCHMITRAAPAPDLLNLHIEFGKIGFD